MKQLQYESGEARIKPEGYQTLDQLVELLKGSQADQLIRVEGHADNMEIGPSLKSQYPTNWDLSKARATGVLRYLVEKGGIDSARISSIGYGATKPLTSNATEPGVQETAASTLSSMLPTPHRLIPRLRRRLPKPPLMTAIVCPVSDRRARSRPLLRSTRPFPRRRTMPKNQLLLLRSFPIHLLKIPRPCRPLRTKQRNPDCCSPLGHAPL